jgi:glutamine transport system substrate-binding protein
MRKMTALLGAAALSAAALAHAQASSGAARVEKSKVLRVLTDLSDPNDVSRLIYRSGGGYDGIEYRILAAFAQTLGARVEVTVVPSFDALFPALERGDGDVAAASITDTPERRKIMDLSASYFPVREAVIVKKGRAATSFADLAGLRAITQKGTTWEAECRKVPRVKLQYTENQKDLFDRVASGAADFSITDSPMAMTYLDKHPDLEIAWWLPERQNYAFALPKGSDLTAKLDETIAKLKSTGVYYALLGSFYGQKGLAILRASEAAGTGQK